MTRPFSRLVIRDNLDRSDAAGKPRLPQEKLPSTSLQSLTECLRGAWINGLVTDELCARAVAEAEGFLGGKRRQKTRSYVSRLRNSQVARLSVKSAIIAMGQVLFRISIGGMSFKKTPLITTMMYRNGFA